MSAISALLEALRGTGLTQTGTGIARPEHRSFEPSAAPVRMDGAGDCEMRFNRMMAAFNVDRGELEQDYPKVMLDARTTCVWCRSKRRCFRELEAGTAAKNAEHFCPNGDILMVFANDPAPAVRDRAPLTR